MKEYDKGKSHISNKFPMIYISSNNFIHKVTKTFIQLSTRHFLSFKLHPTTLHYPVLNIKYYIDKRKRVTFCDMPKVLFHVL